MSYENASKIIEAIHQQDRLLYDLMNVVDESIEGPPSTNKSISRLISAGLIEEAEEGRYIPADNMELLIPLLNATTYSASELPDLDYWKKSFKQAAENFKTALEDEVRGVEGADSFPHKRTLGRLSKRIEVHIRRSIREIELDISSNMDAFPTYASKISQCEYYLNTLTSLQDDYLGKLTIKEIEAIDLPDLDDIEVIVSNLSNKLYDIRELIKRVLGKVVEFSVHFKKLSQRKKRLSQLYRDLKTGSLKLSADHLADRIISENAVAADSHCINFAFNPVAHDLNFSEEKAYQALLKSASKLIDRNKGIIREDVTRESFVDMTIDVDPEIEEEHLDEFALAIQGFASYFVGTNETHGRASIVEYIIKNPIQGISLDIWIALMGEKLFDISASLNEAGYNTKVSLVYEQLPLSKMISVHDVCLEAA